MAEPYSLFFGDIHNHNSLGYGLGSLERSIEVARSHLDFFAFTGHGSWHDMPEMEGDRQQHWLRGFEKLRAAWPTVQDLTRAANEPGEFAAFLGYEWHSSRFGDQCLIFPGDRHDLFLPAHIDHLREYCQTQRGLMIPHHLAYATGNRGVNWAEFDSVCTPVVEVFSEHGNAADDAGPFPYFNHSMGGRVTANTAESGLRQGKKFGMIASSDNHRGFPGGYGEGLAAVWAEDGTRESIMEAIRARRTYAITGDRIEIELYVDGFPMGAEVLCDKEVDLEFRVASPDEIEYVEVIKGDRVIYRSFPQGQPGDFQNPSGGWVRLEFGWGPWADMDLDRVCDWQFSVAVNHGKISEAIPCFQSGPFDEKRRHSLNRTGEGSYDIRSYSARKGGFRGNPNQSVLFYLNAGPESTVTIRSSRPTAITNTVSVGNLWAGSTSVSTGPFPAESMLWHRLVPASACTAADNLLVPTSILPSYVYLRVKLRNGQMAWTSPVFLEKM